MELNMAGILDTRHLDQNIETSFQDKVASADPKFVKYPAGQWTVANPHPGFGIDPNILNEFGHTVYPKWVKNQSGVDVIVNNKKEEEETIPKPAPELLDGGPTIQQYVNAGYRASTYPPERYKAVSSAEEVKEFIDKEKAHSWGDNGNGK
jgi:hypothetical protein